ncbi:SusC/RagA family TonB-linked outer membrane protein [Desertivirga xinjiangensis]|uniref:SusC/RagA family TonB-linked outer membrane protein n=1 Tax=Desertivirga xinjiangensis TaxID=539206 RepID=UPI00210B2859|nr:TonB-dependent receptor [Pedobacter xinjiangensis]
MRKLILLLSFILSVQTLLAQSARTIRGRIVDDQNEPLPGASILLTEEKKSAVANTKGEFSIVSSNSSNKLRITFMGFKPLEVALPGNDEPLILSLAPEGRSMDEVVVVGYGTSTKKDLTGAVSTLSGDLITDRKTTRLSQALQGAVPGLVVTRNSAGPGAGSTMRIRGITTLGVSDPLVLIDGVPGNSDNINPDDVESISVLKDAASSAIYGSRAAAGVILITTKRAKTGQAAITYNADFGLQKISSMPSFADAATWRRLNNEMKRNDGASASTLFSEEVINNYAALNAENPDLYPNTNWQKTYFKDHSLQQRHSLDLTIGTKAVRTKAILGYIKQPGMDPNRSFDRYSLRVNNDMNISSKLSSNVDFAYYRAQSFSPSRDEVWLVRQLAPIYDDFFSDGRYAPGKDGGNPLANNYLGGNNYSRNNQITGRIQLNYDAFKGFRLSGIFAPQFGFLNTKKYTKKVEYFEMNDPSAIDLTYGTTNTLNESQSYSQRINTQLLANYQFKIKDQHSFTTLLGYETYTVREEDASQAREGYLLDYYVINSGPKLNMDNGGGAFENALRSYFGRVTYNFKNKYLLQTNLRLDGSSRFSRDYRWGFFPSVSAGWVISEESFFKDQTPLSFLKFRASWGRNGNQQIGNYSYQALIELGSALLYDSAGKIVPASTGSQQDLAIRDISWETKEDYDLGIDAAMFNNRLSLTADYFHKNTYDILWKLDIPRNMGLNATEQNVAKLINKGWELQAGWNDKLGENWTYRLSANISDYRSKVVDLKGISTLKEQALLEGQPFNVWYGYENAGYFTDATDVANSPKLSGGEKPGDIKYRDVDGDGKITADKDQVALGNSLPRYVYGGNASISFKNIDFGFSFQGIGKQLGKPGKLMYQAFVDNYGNVPSYMVDNTWTPDRTNAKYPRLSYNNRNVNYANSDFYLFNTAYFRLKDVTLGYTFNKRLISKAGMKGLRLFVSATDLFSVSKFPKGWDPEMGVSENPIVTTYYGGLSVTF